MSATSSSKKHVIASRRILILEIDRTTMWCRCTMTVSTVLCVREYVIKFDAVLHVWPTHRAGGSTGSWAILPFDSPENGKHWSLPQPCSTCFSLRVTHGNTSARSFRCCAVAPPHLECEKGRGKRSGDGSSSGVQGQRWRFPRSWSFFVNDCLNFDVLEEQNYGKTAKIP